MAVINHLTDTDLYKLTMMQAVLHSHSGAYARYTFKCRNGTALPFNDPEENKHYIESLNREIDHLCKLTFTREELSYLANIAFLKPDFINYLENFQLNRDSISVSLDSKEAIELIIKGPWVSTIMFEVPVLAIISELYANNRKDFKGDSRIEGTRRLDEKIDYLNRLNAGGQLGGFTFYDMGTRRRFSFNWQEYVLKEFSERCRPMFAGTSNIYLAMKMGIGCMGTMAHEWLQAHQQLGGRLVDFQKAALENWIKEYRDELGIALSDVVGFNAFLHDFDLNFARRFSGVRHDSGDPFKWCKKLIEHYNKLGIDQKTKTAVFSDGLNFQTAVDLYQRFHKKIKTSFGIGTWLTNDMEVEAPQIVIKMVECNGKPVAKVSDSRGKAMFEDRLYEQNLRNVFQLDL